MEEFVFTLTYQLADDSGDPRTLAERLEEAGCGDALVGFRQAGRVALEFAREAESAEAAVDKAVADVQRAIPSAKLIEMTPGMWGAD